MAANSGADRNPVEILADEFAQRLRAGEQPTIDEYVARCPEHATQIRVVFPPIQMMERASEQQQADGQDEASPIAAFRLSRSTIGDFDIVREIGRGGMGVVYEAQQRSLNRRVALKVLGPSVADSPPQLARFEREAEAAARLHHTNIVPVFGTGTENDLHFYVMQFIDGVALSDIAYWLGESTEPDPCPANVPDDEPSSTTRLPLTETYFTAAEAAALLLQGTVQDRSTVRGSSAPSAVGAAASTDSVQQSAREPGYSPARSHEETIVSSREAKQANGDPHTSPDSGSQIAAARLDTLYLRSELYWRNVARIGADLASALSYSHQQGVLHRDIKPSNVLLDRDGIVWVADFGLAKHQDREGVTNAGDIVGTLRYMAPEQFRGQTDGRSDIYSLGLTLYELLALRPAFEETRHGPLIEQKLSATPPSPRLTIPGIPRDLDTIVVKACATEPTHRYQSAAELEADLLRFLEDRPIHARPISPAEWLWRWARRNPWIATLAATTMVLLIATAVVFAIGKYRTEQTLALLANEKGRVEQALGQVKQEKQRVEDQRRKAVMAADVARQAHAQAEENLQAARRENARAEKNLQVAIEAFEQVVHNIASRGVPQSLAVVPGEEISAVTPADAELLEMLLAFFDQFAKHNQVDFAVESAAALKRVGDIHQQLGRLDAAENAYRQALAAYEQLDGQGDSTGSYVVRRARIINALAGISSRRGNIPQAIGAHLRARNLLERSGSAATPEARFELARTLIQKALIGEIAGVRGDGLAGEASPATESRHRRPGRGTQGRGRGRGGPRGGNALDSSDVAIETLTALVSEQPSNPDYRLALAQAYRARVRTFLRLAEHESAERPLRTALAQLDELATDVPDSAALRYELTDTLRTKITTDESYQQRIRRAVALSEQLAADHPDVPPYQSLAGDCLSQLAEIQSRDDDLDAAKETYEQAVEYKRPLANRFRRELPMQLSYVRMLAAFAEVQAGRDEVPAALKLLDDAVLRLETFERDHGPNRFIRRLLNQIQERQASLRPADP